MLKCREVTDRASELIDGDLDLVTRLRVRAHLVACRECRRFIRQMRATVELLGSLDRSGERPADERLVAAYRSKRGDSADGR